MARGVNKAVIIGTLGQDPDLRQTNGGSAVCTLSVATNESWRDKQTGQQQERTEWHRIIAFGHMANSAAKYLKKGSQAYIEGRIQTRKWQDNNGNDRYTTEIVANEIQYLGGRPSNQTTSQAPNNSKQTGMTTHDQKLAEQQASNYQKQKDGEKWQPKFEPEPKPIDDGFEDIPF